MKIAIITDTHWGARADSIVFLDHQKRFLDTVFFPYLQENSISTIFHLGDLVDRRKYINFNTAARMREDFITPIFLGRYDFHMILGNHDIFHKNKSDINAFDELLQYYSKHSSIDTFHTFYKSATECVFDDTRVLFVPWITKDNEAETLDMIKNSTAQICLGHLELNGFVMNLGTVCETGMNASIFDKFDIVMSGHFHQKSQKGNILYLGAPWEITWADYDQPRGFHVFDTKTRNISFVKNPYSLFNRITYNDMIFSKEELLSKVNSINVEGTYCKIVVEEKSNPYTFDLFVKEVEDKSPFDLKIIEQIKMHETEEVSHTQDTLTILNKSIEALDVQISKKKLKTLINTLYNEAISVEVE